MTGKIRVLPVDLRNKIAAGEVVERPASIVKELVENAIDAGARAITVELEGSGTRLIRVLDDGAGMDPEDAALAFERHATSKIRTDADLFDIHTLGFRGEALPSIASVARVRLVTAPVGAATATEVRIGEGAGAAVRPAAPVTGTAVEVADLFFNIPARRKFLKSPATELAHCVRVVRQIALGHPAIQFRLLHQGRVLLECPPAADTGGRILALEGSGTWSQLVPLERRDGAMTVRGFIGKPPFSVPDRDHIELFVNRRAVRNPAVAHAVLQGYGSFLMKHRFPVAFVYLELAGDALDVNVHPAKREVRFRDAAAVYRLVQTAVADRLHGLGFRAPSDAAGLPVAEAPAIYALHPRAAGEPLFAGTVAVAVRPAIAPDLFRDTAPSAAPLEVRLLGQIQNSFILAQVGDDLHILDQHAAHERLLFERLRRQIRSETLPEQALLLPPTLVLPAAAAAVLRQRLPELRPLGLEVEPFGGDAFVIRTVPALAAGVDLAPLLADLVEAWEEEREPASDAFVAAALASIACHAAIKANHPLERAEMARLVDDLYREDVPPTCPHGRPIRRALSRGDLEQLFCRR